MTSNGVDPDPAWARAHAPDLPLAVMSDFEYDQHHFRRTRELQAEAAAEEQALLRQLAILRQQLSKRIADQLKQMDQDRHCQAAELRKRYAEAIQRTVEESSRGNGYGVEDTEAEEKEDAERAAATAAAAAEAAKRERERAAAEGERIAAAREEAAHAETRRKMAELRKREEDLRRNRMRDRRIRDDQAAWRMRAVNLEVANNIRYVDVPWPISTGSSSSTSITSPAAINVHLSSITQDAALTFLAGVAEIDLELQDRKDAVLSTDTGNSSSQTESDSLNVALRRAVLDAIRVFHPDKFYHRVLPRVRHAEKGKVREGVERTSRVLNDLLASIS